MQIKKILTQHRRDFNAIYVCDHCNHEVTAIGYDDLNFHENVIPKMICPECNEIAGNGYRPLATKYPENIQV